MCLCFDLLLISVVHAKLENSMYLQFKFMEQLFFVFLVLHLENCESITGF